MTLGPFKFSHPPASGRPHRQLPQGITLRAGRRRGPRLATALRHRVPVQAIKSTGMPPTTLPDAAHRVIRAGGCG